jgi:hypothetical protein
LQIDFSDVIDHYLHRIAARGEKIDHLAQQPPCAVTVDRRQDNQPWMKLGTREKRPKIARVLRDFTLSSLKQRWATI